MTRRATFTEAELVRAIRAAGKAGKVAVQTRDGIAFVDPATIQNDRPEEPEANGCDRFFGVSG